MGWPVQSSCLVVSADGTRNRRPGTAVSLLQRGVIIFDGETQTMIVKFLYRGHGDLFGCVGTVPTHAWIKPVDDAPFERLDAAGGRVAFLTTEALDREGLDSARARPLFNLELQRSLDEMSVWKGRNGFRDVSEKERDIFEYYLSREMMFLTALVPYGYPCENGRIAEVWTQPVQVAFEADRITYPLLASKVEDGTHTYVSLDILTTAGRPVDVPPPFEVVAEGEQEVGYRQYSWSRIEARLEFEDIKEDLELVPARGAW